MLRRTAHLLAVVAALALAPLAAVPARAADAPAAPVTADARALLDEGKQLFADKHFREAADKFHAAYALDQSLGIALYNEAFALRKAGLMELARDAYGRFLAAEPNDLDALWGLAECERALGNAP